MTIRKGRQLYSKKYEEAMRLHEQGKSVNEIASAMDISYSAAYHWVKGLRRPETGRTNDFEDYLRNNGPMPVVEIKNKFPKHNEIFLTSSKRGLKIKRKILQRRYGQYAIWYYLEGQEAELEKRLKELHSKVKEVREKLREKMFK